MNFDEIILKLIDEQGGRTKESLILKYLLDCYPQFFEIQENPLSFYQRHFYLFHQLYKLRRKLGPSKQSLVITSIEICLVDKSSTTKELSKPDLLSAFYLDMNNFYLPEEEVEKMLQSFWLKYTALDKKSNALSVLGLTGIENINLKLLKSRFNKLALEKHPDRGGNPEEFQEIKLAYQELKPLFNK